MSYETLKSILSRAYDQASSGKGVERHATSPEFLEQPIFKIQALFTTHGPIGPAFQAIKKIQEGVNNYNCGRFNYPELERELLGAINYIAAILIAEEQKLGDSYESGQAEMSPDWYNFTTPAFFTQSKGPEIKTFTRESNVKFDNDEETSEGFFERREDSDQEELPF